MSAEFPVQPIGRFAGASQPVKRPKEFACFSYDKDHQFHLDDSSLKYYYNPQIGADLSRGFDTFQKQDDTADEHLDSLLKTIMAHEKETGARIDANLVTWRGMMTKVCNVLNHENHALTIDRSWLLRLSKWMGMKYKPRVRRIASNVFTDSK